MERGVVDGVTVDLADVKVGTDFGDMRGSDSVGCAPDFGCDWGVGGVRIIKGAVVGVGDEGYDATWGSRRAAVVFAEQGVRDVWSMPAEEVYNR